MVTSTSKKREVIDPIVFMKRMWPDIQLYDKQIEVVYSFMNDAETVVPAGNQLGKDFIAGRLVLWYFQSRQPCRVVTTSAKDDHLRVLWGEINDAINSAAFPMDVVEGGNLIINQREIRKMYKGKECPISYIKGMVAGSDSIAAMQGHHVKKTGDGIPRTAVFCDESSSVPDAYYKMFTTWADRMFIFGNTWPCNNFFYKAIKGDKATGQRGGDIPRDNGQPGYYRRVIKIVAEDSPNVKLGLEQKRRGLPVTNEQIIPGVKNYEEYEKNLKRWDKVQQTVCLHAEFYEGAEVRLFPQEWLDRAEELGNRLLHTEKKGQTLGSDSAHGGDNTAWAVSNPRCLLALISEKTPDTSVITGKSLAIAREWGVDSSDILFDAGGGGKEHADRLRAQGHKVRIVAFGESPTSVNTFKRMKTSAEKTEEKEERIIYKNRRAEMYGILRQLLDPAANPQGFGIPSSLMNKPRSDGGPSLRNQLSPIPLTYDDEGRLYLLPKNKKPNAKEGDDVKSLTELIGCSPDEADAFVLSIFGIMHKATRVVAGAVRLNK